MDVNDPRFEEYENIFRELADQSELVKVAEPSLNSSRYFLCLYGENGLPTEEEFALLERMREAAGKSLKRLEVETDYYQDVILFVP